MIKNTIIALVAAASLAGVAVPAFAAPAPEESDINTVFGGGSTEMREFIADSVLSQLQQKGVNATAVEDWSGLIRAYVTLEDGSQTMQFFKPGSLEQVQL
ncbi:hypothetical protein ASD04_08640 [Devosia sp. Root436]|jgi:hypothetical protein|uniref:hypothetical protein n=1 Tax=Devosia sp. Root436 TaxID=1736537 RepID=UPI0006F96908|nr:hypothetical protein [Devosia sp. Root436]KQX38711.1 hypothetical protein ASD04_08640 [Devosia sp. Root436]